MNDSADLTLHLDELSRRHPEAPALLAPGRRRMSFASLARHRAHTVARLREWGIGRGDVVVWINGHRAQTAAALAIVPASATLALLSPATPPDDLAAILERIGPKAIVLPPGREGALHVVAARHGLAVLGAEDDGSAEAGAFELDLAMPRASLERPRVHAPSWACINVTSGATGSPKIVPHGHFQVLLTAAATGERLGLSSADIAGHVMPLHLSGGIRNGYYQTILCGGAVNVLPEGGIEALVGALAAGEVTYLSASFTMLRDLLARIEGGERVDRGRLRCLRVASGRMEPDEMDRLERALGVPVLTGLACSEAGSIAQQAPGGVRRRGSVGAPVATEVRLVDGDGRDVTRGAAGELLVRGPQVFDGYVDDDALNASAFVDGWFRVGDLARLDEDGELHLVGRVNEVINRGGEKISPVEIDAVLCAQPDVAEAAVFGLPHPSLGEEVVAAIVVAPGAPRDANALLARLRPILGSRRTPRRLWFVDSLPRTEAGKLQRSALPSWVGADPWPGPAEPRAAVAPVSPIEVALGGLWAATLRLASVPRDGDFFMLGGDSLRGASLVEQVRTVFGIDVPVAALFEDAGTLAGMARRVETAREARVRPTTSAAIPRRDPRAAVPLAHTQARVWFLQRLDPASDAYHESRLWHLDGDLDIEALREALAMVARRQLMLRTRYVTAGGVPQQDTTGSPSVALEVVGLAAAPGRLDEAVHERVSRPFDLAAAPPARFTLFRLGPSRHALLRVWHHIMSDGLSSPILQRDLSAAYAAAKSGRPPAWPDLPVDYADYTLWQRRELEKPEARAALEACVERLAGTPTLALPTDRVRPPAQSFRGAVVTRPFPAIVAQAMKRLGREQGATPFMTFLAAYAALLSRLSGDEDFAIGTPFGGRTRSEFADLIGFFANTLVVRVDASGGPGFAGFLRRIRGAVLGAFEAQDVPFERLVDGLGLARDPSRNPLFQVAFGMRESDGTDLAFDGVTVRRDPSRHGRAKFDLTLTLIDAPEGITAHWEYCADLFDRAPVERMARQFEALSAAAVEAPGLPLASLPLLDSATRERVATLNAASDRAPPHGTIVTRFEAQAARRPDAVAIGALSYRDLDGRANRLAQALRAAGVARGGFVGVARSKPADIAVAWLAVLKAGAAYVPIDTELPAARVEFMLGDARIRVVIADDVTASRLARPGVTVFCPEREKERLDATTPVPPAIDLGADDPAYVIYTSGSTGTPKGVVVPHGAVLRLVLDTDYLQLHEGDVVAQMANPSFDASTFEFWGALLNGARIAPITKTVAIAPRSLAATLASERVTALFVTTALFNAVAREVPAAFAPLTCVMFGGEAVEPRWVREVLRAGAPARLLHVYGPTEVTTFATWHEVRAVRADAATVPIGRPIAQTDAFVLRGDGELAAPGEAGELWLGGPGLALGYLGRDDLTAERFAERDVAPLGRRRLYRTGDRVRMGEDGVLDYLGRFDRQVKVRGHRIELEEVEAALARLPGVREAVVSLRGETSQTRQLVAYLVASNPGAPPGNLLRGLRRHLPDPMLPGAIVWLPALPLNANGKVDRGALPAPGDVGGRQAGVRAAPRDIFESVLLEIWQELLGHEAGVFDRFFETGGHSLLAAQLVDTVERRTGYALPLTAMFADDTVAGLAKVIREQAPNDPDRILAVNESGSLPPFIYLHGDFQGGGFYSRTLALALGPDQPTWIVHPHGLVDDRIPDTIEEMARELVAALRSRRPAGPYLLGGHCNGALVAFEMARQLVEEGEVVPVVVVIEASAPSGSGATGGADSYVKFDPMGRPQALTPSDRRSHAELRYLHAIDRYAPGRFAGRLVAIGARDRRQGSSAGFGWEAFADSVEPHRVSGSHTTLLTTHLDELVAVVRGALARATNRAPRSAETETR